MGGGERGVRGREREFGIPRSLPLSLCLSLLQLAEATAPSTVRTAEYFPSMQEKIQTEAESPGDITERSPRTRTVPLLWCVRGC